MTTARAAGLFYVLTIAAGLYAEVYTRSILLSGKDPLAAIMAHPGIYRSGMFADLTMLGAYIVVTVLFYGLFLGAGARLSTVAAGFSMIGIAVLSMTSLLHMVPLILTEMASADGGVNAAAMTKLALRLHGAGYGISLTFFGAYCVLIGALCLRSRRVPVAVGALMILGGIAHLLNHYVGLIAPDMAAALPRPILMLPLLGEGALALWLTLFAVRVDRPNP